MTGKNDMKAALQALLCYATILTGVLLLPLPDALAEEECQSLVRNKCTTCHFVTYICPRIEKGKGRFAWKGIVKDMIKEGMVATDQEQERLVDCLADPDAKVRALCPQKQ
jgi:hypothetical protein